MSDDIPADDVPERPWKQWWNSVTGYTYFGRFGMSDDIPGDDVPERPWKQWWDEFRSHIPDSELLDRLLDDE
jgi:hypothetical protein